MVAFCGCGCRQREREGERASPMVKDGWEELLGSAVKKKVIVDGDGDVPDFGSVVVFNWIGSEMVDGIDGLTGTAFGERKRATARIGDGDEIPGIVAVVLLRRALLVSSSCGRVTRFSVFMALTCSLLMMCNTAAVSFAVPYSVRSAVMANTTSRLLLRNIYEGIEASLGVRRLLFSLLLDAFLRSGSVCHNSYPLACGMLCVLSAVELGLRHMRAGEQCIIRCESRFAYGPEGCPATREGDADLPPNSDIEVRVELLGVKSTASVSDMNPQETIAEGERKKVVGNGHFERAAYKKALRAYTSAANTVAGVEFTNEDANAFREARQLRIDCSNNIATTCVRLGDLDKAKEAAVGVLELDPNNTKALFRAGQVSSLQSNFIEASLALKRALELNPTSKEILAELQRLSARERAYKKKRQAVEKTMARNLFAGPKTESVDHKGISNGPSLVGAIGPAFRDQVVGVAEKHKPAALFGAQTYRGVLGCAVVALIAWTLKNVVESQVGLHE